MPKRPPSSSEPWSSLQHASAGGPTAGARALIALLRAYRILLRPALPPACRFVPSCSEFAIEAIERRGALRGVGLALARVARCHPWHAGGHDPVPGAGA